MKTKLACVALLGAAVFGACQAQAAEMIFTETATANGSLNGVVFSNKLITITGEADTNGIHSLTAGVYRIENVPLSLTIQGMATVHFTDEMYVVSNQNNHFAGFIDLTHNSNALLFASQIDNATYDLGAPFGPVTGVGGVGLPMTYATDGGGFKLTNPPRSVTFQAMLAPVPEPATWLMMLGGLGALGAVLRRRREALVIA